MNKFIAKAFSNIVPHQKAKIKFIGKRSLFEHANKHLVNQHVAEIKKEEVVKIKPNMSMSSFNKYRPVITQEEMDIINNGGVLNIKDWNKIKLKKKI